MRRARLIWRGAAIAGLFTMVALAALATVACGGDQDEMQTTGGSEVSKDTSAGGASRSGRDGG